MAMMIRTSRADWHHGGVAIHVRELPWPGAVRRDWLDR